MHVAAMACPVYERPERSRRLTVLGIPTEQPGSNSKQNPPAQAQPFCLRFAPWKRLEQWKPRVFKSRQLTPADSAAQQLPGDCAQARFGGDSAGIEFFQALAPPGEADRPE